MATQRDLEEINRQYPGGPDGPRIDDAIGFVRAHPWGNGMNEKPQVAWPERDFYESDESYIISMLKQLFVELAELKSQVEMQRASRWRELHIEGADTTPVDWEAMDNSESLAALRSHRSERT